MPSSASLLGALPPIDAAPVQPERVATAPVRSPAEQAELEKELDELHEALGVKRGQALQEAMKPELTVPMPPMQLSLIHI